MQAGTSQSFWARVNPVLHCTAVVSKDMLLAALPCYHPASPQLYTMAYISKLDEQSSLCNTYSVPFFVSPYLIVKFSSGPRLGASLAMQPQAGKGKQFSLRWSMFVLH